MTRQRSARYRVAAPLAFFAVAPFLLVAADAAPFLVRANLVFLAITAVGATGLTLTMGFAGQVSLGHAAFYGIGAYSTAIFTVEWGWPPVVALLAGVVIAAAIGAVLARVAFRLTGHFLAMATLAFGLIFFYSVRLAAGVTGGNTGRGGIPDLGLGGWKINTDTRMFILTWIVLGLGIVVAGNVVRSGAGRALVAIANAETAAACCGVNVTRAKTGVFVLGAMYGSVAGSLYAHYVSYISPDAFGLLVSVQFLVVSTVGGIRSVWGPPVGAFVLMMLTEVSRDVVPRFVRGASVSYETISYGLALVLVLLLFDRGIAGSLAHWAERRRGNNYGLDVDTAEVEEMAST